MANSGGNKKTASQSDRNYWQRAKASNYHETHRAKRINRHVSAMMRREKTTSPNRRKELAAQFDATPEFPKIRIPRPMEKVVDKANIPAGVLKQHQGNGENLGYPLYQGYSAGVLIEQSFNLSSVNAALDGSPQERHVYIQHPTGRRELLSYTPTR